MDHAFNVKVATDFDVNTAIFLQNLKFWTLHNLAHKQNIHDGRAWAYYTLEGLTLLFPYWSIRQVRVMIDNCIKNDLIIKSNHNKTKYDRTCWYALTDKSFKYFPELINPVFMNALNLTTPINTDLSEMTNGSDGNDTPIPDTIPDTKKNIPIIPLKDSCFNEFWNSYPVKKDRKKCLAFWKRKNLDPKTPLIIAKIKIQKEKDKYWLDGYIPNPLTYLRGERWDDEITPPKPKPQNPVDQGKSPVAPTEKEDKTAFSVFLGGIATDIRLGLIDNIPQISMEEWKRNNFGEDHRAYLKKLNIQIRQRT